MKKNKIALVLVLVLLLSACNTYSAMYDLPGTPTIAANTLTAIPATNTTTATPARVTPAPLTCQVKTGIDAGMLNMRTGAGVDRDIVRVLVENETLTVIARGPWLEVKDMQGNHGFINSKYCNLGD